MPSAMSPYNNMPSPSRSSSTSSASSTVSHPDTEPIKRSPCRTMSVVSVEVIRCMRCGRSTEATSTDDLSTLGMVPIATGLFYCRDCAALVGFQK